jgi:hypothetical protein
MNLNPKKFAWLHYLCRCLLDARSAIAQRDRVYDYEGKNTSGKITAVTAQGVELEW